LVHFPHVPIKEVDYDRAAEGFNVCRREGIAAGAIDMLICAIALRIEAPVHTTDADFARYAGALGITLFERA
jgi:predicted nucleic acid-binding protein